MIEYKINMNEWMLPKGCMLILLICCFGVFLCFVLGSYNFSGLSEVISST